MDYRNPEAKLQDFLCEVFGSEPAKFLAAVSEFVPRYRQRLPNIGTVGPGKWWFDAVIGLRQQGLLKHAPFWASLQVVVADHLLSLQIEPAIWMAKNTELDSLADCFDNRRASR